VAGAFVASGAVVFLLVQLVIRAHTRSTITIKFSLPFIFLPPSNKIIENRVESILRESILDR